MIHTIIDFSNASSNYRTSHKHIYSMRERRNLVLIPSVPPSVSPGRKATVDGLSLGSAMSMTPWHCSGVAKLGKYSARGLQLKIYGK